MKKAILNYIRTTSIITVWVCASPWVIAQVDSSFAERIAITGRPHADSITLRWAPLTYSAWRAGNSNGYRVERYVMARGGKFLTAPEKAIVQNSLFPWPVPAWESIVHSNRYAAIAAQALFGDHFEVDLQQSDVLTIVNKVKENEQRFAFTLFSADLSPNVAEACGLLFTDRTVKPGEKYLYRVFVNSCDSLRGSIFISPDDPYQLPRPQNLRAEFKEDIVLLKWDRSPATTYTAYIIERSEDGVRYSESSDIPLITVSPDETIDTRYEYATDSLPDPSRVYYYRVKGITPFGEQSPASEAVKGRAMLSVDQVPFIVSAENVSNTAVLIKWDFPEKNNSAISGFSVERAAEPNAPYVTLHEKLIRPDTRTFEDMQPDAVNYYRVLAHGIDGHLYPSHLYYAQLIDSIPPAKPTGLSAKVSDEGKIELSWAANMDPDIFGYRIYKGHHRSEEPAQITESPLSGTTFTDTVDLNTLNETVYYQVMAIDINQNHSLLSESLEVPLPDKLKPLPPVFLPAKTDSGRTVISWAAGGSEDITAYKLYRKVAGADKWTEITTRNAGRDSLFFFVDSNPLPGQTTYYTAVSVDEAGLESQPASPISTIASPFSFRAPVVWKKPEINKESNRITLKWNYNARGVKAFRLFRASDRSSPISLAFVEGTETKFIDTVIPMHTYAYRIMALFESGEKSLLSEELKLDY